MMQEYKRNIDVLKEELGNEFDKLTRGDEAYRISKKEEKMIL